MVVILLMIMFYYKYLKNKIMKKLFKISIAIVSMVILFASCKSAERCYAYGNMGRVIHHVVGDK